MRSYPYLRAYMAGITIPTVMLILLIIVFTVARYALKLSEPIERLIVFPMAIVPNLWGFWNMLFLRLSRRRYLPIGFHGAILALFQTILALGLFELIGFEIPQFSARAWPLAFPVIAIGFYLAWKYAVAFLNTLMGIEG
jgi:hypothetical protein